MQPFGFPAVNAYKFAYLLAYLTETRLENDILNTHKTLVEGSKAGDIRAQKKLYELYVDAMYNVSYRMVRNREDAEDILQDSFVHAFTHLSNFRYESTFGSWLKRIVINTSINHLKKKRIPVTSLETHAFHLGTEGKPQESPPKDISKIKRAINRLADGYRQILTLYLIEGYDHVEIGEILGIATSTSKSQYHRAKKRLIQEIQTL